MTTVHALVMIFGVVMPGTVGFANWLLPLTIGAPDMALPRMNNWGFWILPLAFSLLFVTFFLPGGGPATGWTMCPPLMLQTDQALPFVIFAIHFLGVSSIMGSKNNIATILNMRAPGMKLMSLPLFVWTWLVTAFLLIASVPVLAGAVTMLLTDKFLRAFSTRLEEEIQYCFSTYSGSLDTLKSIFLSCQRSASFLRLSRPLHVNLYSVMWPGSRQLVLLHFCRF